MEILAETLVGQLEEKERDFQKAQNVRSEYAQDVEEIQFWLQRAEAKIEVSTCRGKFFFPGHKAVLDQSDELKEVQVRDFLSCTPLLIKAILKSNLWPC